jgi:uncharacterized membrane protein YeaQ/YmgE (transglycosylase-associated protein family)
MGIGSLIVLLLVGAIAGWLASKIMRGRGFGLLGNIVVGIIGAVIGGWLFGLLGFAALGIVARIISATVGAIVLLYVVQLVKRA